jgi:hypothetical protein
VELEPNPKLEFLKKKKKTNKLMLPMLVERNESVSLLQNVP